MDGWTDAGPSSKTRSVTGSRPPVVVLGELDQTKTRRRDHRLELGMHTKLLDHMGHVPLNRMRGNAHPSRQRLGVVAFGQQPENIELPWRELGDQLLPSLLLVRDHSLACDRLGEESDRDQDLAD